MTSKHPHLSGHGWRSWLLAIGIVSSFFCVASVKSAPDQKNAPAGTAGAPTKISPKPATVAPGTAVDVKTPGARLVIEKEVVDVGNVVRGQPATAVFEIRNAGDEVLRILDAKPG